MLNKSGLVVTPSSEQIRRAFGISLGARDERDRPLDRALDPIAPAYVLCAGGLHLSCGGDTEGDEKQS